MTPEHTLNSLTMSAFCESMALLLDAGSSADEAAALLGEDTAENDLHDAALSLLPALHEGQTLAEAVAASGYFPGDTAHLIALGEMAGRTDEVLRALAVTYENRHRLDQRLRSAVVYPLVLLALMAAVLAVLLGKVLPVFGGVYQTLAAGAGPYLQAAYLIGWAALAVTGAAALFVLALVLTARTDAGRKRLAGLFAACPLTAPLSARLSLARFAQGLALFTASGLDCDAALDAAAPLAADPAVQKKLDACRTEMQAGAGLATAVSHQRLFEPLYNRMLLAAAHSGALDAELNRLARLLEEDADDRLNAMVDTVEPALSAFLTAAVGVTLLAALLPLAGMLNALG